MGKIAVSQEVYEQYASVLGDWLPKDAAIAVAVGDCYIHYQPGAYDIHLKKGQLIMPGSIAEKVIRQRRKVDIAMDETLFGVPYYGIGYPIDLQDGPGALIVILPPEHHSLRQEPFRFLTGKQEDEWSPIPTGDITHIESFQKKTWFYANEEQYSISMTLKDLSLRLPKTFIRIHRSYIVNIPAIQRITRDFSSNLILILKDETELPVSQSYVNEVKHTLGF